jgi:hypothetical protein
LSSSEQIVGLQHQLTPLHQRVALAVACTLPGLLVRLTGGATPHPLRLLAYGAAVVAGAFMLAWASEAAQEDIGHGIVCAAAGAERSSVASPWRRRIASSSGSSASAASGRCAG